MSTYIVTREVKIYQVLEIEADTEHDAVRLFEEKDIDLYSSGNILACDALDVTLDVEENQDTGHMTVELIHD